MAAEAGRGRGLGRRQLDRRQCRRPDRPGRGGARRAGRARRRWLRRAADRSAAPQPAHGRSGEGIVGRQHAGANAVHRSWQLACAPRGDRRPPPTANPDCHARCRAARRATRTDAARAPAGAVVAASRWRRCCPPSCCCRRSRPTARRFTGYARIALADDTVDRCRRVGAWIPTLRDGLDRQPRALRPLRHRGDRRHGARRRVRDLRRSASCRHGGDRPAGADHPGCRAVVPRRERTPVLRHRARHRRRRVRAVLPADRRHQVRRDRRRGGAGALAQARRLAGAAEHVRPVAGADRPDPRYDALHHAAGRRGGRAFAGASRPHVRGVQHRAAASRRATC